MERPHHSLLRVVCLWGLLTAGVHSCPEACSKCPQPDNDRCGECREGWTLHNYSCVDVDECDSALDSCPEDSYCFNTEGSYECRGCDVACAGCRGTGPAHCRKCAAGFRLSGSKCLDIDECSDRVLACAGLDEICVNTAGSFRCVCAKGFVRRKGTCVRKRSPDASEMGLFDNIQDDEVEVLQQMFFGALLCALGTLAAKGDMVYTSLFIGAVAATSAYWLSDRGDRLVDRFLRAP